MSFEPLKLGVPGWFGVRLSGSVGRAEKGRLKELAAKCLENGKTHVLMDLSELEAIGGGGAAALADFQRQLDGQGGQLEFCGANEIVLRFLRLQFVDLPLRVHANVEEAGAALPPASESTRRAKPELATLTAPPPRAAVATKEPTAESRPLPESGAEEVLRGSGRTDQSLDDLLGCFVGSAPGTADDAAPPKRAGPSSSSAVRPPAASTSPAPPSASELPLTSASPATAAPAADRPRFVPLERALAALRSAPDTAAMAPPLRDLLHSHDLAAETTLLARQGDCFIAHPGEDSLPAAGPLATALQAAGRPLSLLDFQDSELSEGEMRLVARLRPDLVLPLVRSGDLQGMLFVRRGDGRHEYSVGEVFGLSLLTHDLAPANAVAANPDERGVGRDLSSELKRKIFQMQSLFSISEDFARVRDEARLLELLSVAITTQLGVRTVAFLTLYGDALTPTVARGLELASVPRLQPLRPDTLEYLVAQPMPVPAAELPPPLSRFREELAKSGLAYVAPLRTRGQLLGLLLLGTTGDGNRTELDLDYLSTLLNQAAIALDNARMLQRVHEQSLGMVRTLVSLIEQRNQVGGQMTERISHLVGEVAREVNLPPEKLRDLTFGTVLRDIGMIPISDLVLRSPRKLTESEWRLIKQHPETGVQLLGPLHLGPTVGEVVHGHHERFNGEGYPRGLQGRAIPQAARIVGVVESYVAMITDLPYRAALATTEAINILSENWGMRYDPELVEALLRVLAREGREAIGGAATPPIDDVVGAVKAPAGGREP